MKNVLIGLLVLASTRASSALESVPTAQFRFRILQVSEDGSRKHPPKSDQQFQFRLRSAGWEPDGKRAVTANGNAFSAPFSFDETDLNQYLKTAVPPGSLDQPLRLPVEIVSVNEPAPKFYDLTIEVNFPKRAKTVVISGSDLTFAVVHLWQNRQADPEAELVYPLMSGGGKKTVSAYFPQFKARFCLDSIDNQPAQGKFEFGFEGSARTVVLNLSENIDKNTNLCSPAFSLNSDEINQGLVQNGIFAYPFRYPIRLSGRLIDPALKNHLKSKYRLRVQLSFESDLYLEDLNYELMPFADNERTGVLNFGLLIWRNQFGEPRSATYADYNRQRYYRPTNAIKSVSAPKHFTIADGFYADNDLIAWEEGIKQLKRLGINTLFTGLHFNAAIRNFMGELKIKLNQYRPLDSNFSLRQNLADPAQCQMLGIKDYQQFAKQLLAPALQSGFNRDQVALIAIADEPIWVYPQPWERCQDPKIVEQWHQQFQNFLKKVAQAEALPFPQAFGSQTVKGLRPLWQRPSSEADITLRRLFYWTVRFFTRESILHYTLTTQALQKELARTDLKVYANLNNFRSAIFQPTESNSPFTGSGNLDWFELANLKGTSLPWSENWQTDQDNWEGSFQANLLKSVAGHGRDFGSYLVARQSDYSHDPSAGGLLRKVLTLVGNGAKTFEYYIFGPEYLFPANSYSEDTQIQSKMAEANALIAQAEDLAFPGKSPAASIAMVLPSSSNLWQNLPRRTGSMDWYTEYNQELGRLFLALKNSNVPVQFINEEDLRLPKSGPACPGALKNYRVIYLTEPNLPARAQMGLKAWVSACGGTLATVAGAAQFDEYNQKLNLLGDAKFFGFEETITANLPLATSHLMEDELVRPYGQSTCSHCEGDQMGRRQIKIPLRFSDQTPAIMEKRVGRGQVVHFPWLPGTAYFRTKRPSSLDSPSQLPIDYSEKLRQWITYPVRLSGWKSPILVDAPLVETLSLSSKKGEAVILINWDQKPINQLQVTFNSNRDIACVVSAKNGRLLVSRTTKSGLKKVVLPLAAGDILSVYPRPVPQCLP